MEITKEKVIEEITSELDDCLESHNAEIFDWANKVLDVDLENQTITLKFNYNVVPEDNYIGLAFY